MLLVMVVIFMLSALPGDELHQPFFPGDDKVAHLVVYGALAAAALFAISPRWRRIYPAAVCLVVVMACLIYGISDEFHQSFVPGRNPSAADLVADGVGALIVCLAWFRYRRRWQSP